MSKAQCHCGCGLIIPEYSPSYKKRTCSFCSQPADDGCIIECGNDEEYSLGVDLCPTHTEEIDRLSPIEFNAKYAERLEQLTISHQEAMYD